jgi:hypothetical protein
MRHSLYRYYSSRKWADAFLDGQLRFNSLAYFRDFEDMQVRGDKNEGKMIFRPEDGLVITNQTQGWIQTVPRALNVTVKQEEIFVFCMSRSFTEELREGFKAVACVEILNVKTFCNRIESALPSETTFPGKPGRERNWTTGYVLRGN